MITIPADGRGGGGCHLAGEARGGAVGVVTDAPRQQPNWGVAGGVGMEGFLQRVGDAGPVA